MPKIAAVDEARNRRIQDDIEHDARMCVYDAVESLFPDGVETIRNAAVEYAVRCGRGDPTVDAIKKMDLTIPAENLSCLALAWTVMDITDATPDGGIGHLLVDFVDLYNSPSNVDVVHGLSPKNIALILQTADRVREYLSSKEAAAQ